MVIGVKPWRPGGIVLSGVFKNQTVNSGDGLRLQDRQQEFGRGRIPDFYIPSLTESKHAVKGYYLVPERKPGRP
jgi:hypothetical protein